ncbi:HPP family-domain-containing protein [Pseudoneurospora amorphoporcata]|uniref:HPP family-domain-containing protein n=1 Tax=Pseudoneurospora amorphoporcata TaxID=241081 RepID=A0AAN6NLP9_9PEZI|nr:HPP family-domain-containing protein [Pseudoneurospora amorphoporcata]
MPKPTNPPKWYRTPPTTWHLDTDRYLNPFVPASVLHHFPTPVAYFLGYRDAKRPLKKPPGNVAVIFFAFVGIFATLTVIAAVGEYYEGFRERGGPVVVGSFGAAAVLEFYAIESPLSQPRNAILGQLFSCIVGISTAKLFALSPHFESIRWLGAALACASATAVMALTGTVHPPAGATALMAVLDDKVQGLGWFLIAPVMLGCAIMLCCALVVNNLRRRFPFYWWSPEETGAFWGGKMKGKGGREKEREKGAAQGKGGSGSEETVNNMKGTSTSDERLGEARGDGVADIDMEAQMSTSTTESGDDGENDDDDGGPGLRVVITRGRVEIPEGLNLRPEEVRFLETISERL